MVVGVTYNELINEILNLVNKIDIYYISPHIHTQTYIHT